MSRRIVNQLEQLKHRDHMRPYSDGIQFILDRPEWINLFRGGKAVHASASIYRIHQRCTIILAHNVRQMKLGNYPVPIIVRRLQTAGLIPASFGAIPETEAQQMVFDLLSAIAALHACDLPVSPENVQTVFRFDQLLMEHSHPFDGRPFSTTWTWKKGRWLTVFTGEITKKLLESDANSDTLILMASQGQTNAERAVAALESSVSPSLYSGAL